MDMKKFLHLASILTLMVWGGMFLYFYVDGRVEKFLSPSFRLYALLAGIGLIILALFNFLNRERSAGVCNHEHLHGDDCQHDHHHDHGDDHGLEHSDAHQHEPEHGEGCAHDHKADCGHDHSHDHHPEHAPVATVGHVHSHDESSGSMLFNLIILLVPLLAAAAYSKDQFSSEYLAKWGRIERQMMQMRVAQANQSSPATASAKADDPTAPLTNPYTSDAIAAAEAEALGLPAPSAAPASSAAPADTPPGNAWGTFTIEDLKKLVPQSTSGDFLLDVPQIFYTAGDRELMAVMEGIPVETTAQLMPETHDNPNQTRLKAFRLFIECCAADARPISIPVDFEKAPPDYQEMGWYRLYGTLHFVEEENGLVPLMKMNRIEPTTEPTDGLLF
jgi:hypothetical protein